MWHGERLLQTYFKALYDVDFTLHRRPNWLVTATGIQLEFDGYSPQHRIAIEHNGEGHYKFIPKFHHSKADFARQRRNDARKKYLCRKYGIALIIIPKLYTHNPPAKLPYMVKRIYAKKGLRLPSTYHSIMIKSDGSVWKTQREAFHNKLVQVK